MGKEMHHFSITRSAKSRIALMSAPHAAKCIADAPADWRRNVVAKLLPRINRIAGAIRTELGVARAEHAGRGIQLHGAAAIGSCTNCRSRIASR